MSVIPPDLRTTIERQTGASVVGERARGGGGASRHGAEVTLRCGDGVEQDCYLAWDPRAGDPSRLPFFERETAVLAALSGPFADSGIKIARLVAADPAHLALCSVFVGGEDRFPEAPDKPALVRDFVSQLAR